MTSREDLRSLIEFVEEYANQEELESPYGVRAILDNIEKDLDILKIFKPRVRLIITNIDKKSVAFIETSGFVFTDSKEYELLKEWLENEIF